MTYTWPIKAPQSSCVLCGFPVADVDAVEVQLLWWDRTHVDQARWRHYDTDACRAALDD